MKDYQKRVVAELDQLNEKREKLRTFIQNQKLFKEVDDKEQQLMIGQLQLMIQYADILERRIKAFE